MLCLVISCATTTRSDPGVHAAAAVVAPAQQIAAVPAEEPPAAPAAPVTPSETGVARAGELLASGERLYRKGDYQEAEAALKEAVTLYPFLPNANLLLGKIFLIRGSATRDLSLIRSAQLMFEMARALDPELREAEVLLDLFKSPPPE